MRVSFKVAAALMTAAVLVVPAALTAAPASAQVSRAAISTTARAAAPTAKLSADRRYLTVNLDRRFRGATVTVRVKLRSTYVTLGKLRLNRNGDGRLKVPAARVRSMKAKLPTRIIKAGKTIGSASMSKAAPVKPAPQPPILPAPVPPALVLPAPVPPAPVLPAPTTPAVPEVAAQDFMGSGDQVVPLAAVAARSFMATVTGAGTSNFIVWALDSTGQKSDLIVNEIGNFPSATMLVDVPRGETIDGFQVTASGTTWTLQVRPLSTATSWTAGQTNGQGSTVLAVGEVTRVSALSLSNIGSSNFIVWAVDAAGHEFDLLVNEIGNYSGTVVMPVGTRYLSIESVGGSWAASRS